MNLEDVMKLIKRMILVLTLAGLSVQAEELTIWDVAPATQTQKQAYPIGNGYMGAMLFGGVPEARISFNEESLWIGDEKDSGSYQAFGDVWVYFDGHVDVGNYRRELDIRRGVHTVSYTSGGVNYTRESFASYPRRLIVMRVTADQPGALSGMIKLTDAHDARVTEIGNALVAKGALKENFRVPGNPRRQLTVTVPYQVSLSYEAQLRVLHDGGELTWLKDGKCLFREVDQLTLYLDAGTDYVPDRSQGWTGKGSMHGLGERLKQSVTIPYDDLLAEHVNDVQSPRLPGSRIFRRCSHAETDQSLDDAVRGSRTGAPLVPIWTLSADRFFPPRNPARESSG
jgi:alpha-L-fucosidase 2